jgi:hypothetical protein
MANQNKVFTLNRRPSNTLLITVLNIITPCSPLSGFMPRFSQQQEIQMSIGAVSSNAVPVNIAGQTKRKDPAATAASQTATASPATASTVKAALQEATETAAETAKEAGQGDRQAQKLVAQHAHHSATQVSTPASKPPSVVNATGQIIGEIINTKA